MATDSLLFAAFDIRRDIIALFSERLNSHCKVLGIDESKEINLLIASLDKKSYAKNEDLYKSSVYFRVFFWGSSICVNILNKNKFSH